MIKLKHMMVIGVSLIAMQASAEPIVPAIPGAAPVQQVLATNMDTPVAPEISPNVPASEEINVIQGSRSKDSRDAEIQSLQIENDLLRQRSRISEAIAEATQKPAKASFIGADTVYDYRDGGVYRVYCAANDISDIQLQPGEILTSEPVAGDTVRWVMASTKSGSPPNEAIHILLKPHNEGLSTTVIIATNKHVYKLRAIAVANFYQPGIRWNYPQEEADKLSTATANAKQVEMATQVTSVSPDKLDFNYTIHGSDTDWRPVQVFNDGKKTYLKMPPSMATSEAPALFVLDEDGNTMLVNYRVKDGVYIVDRLFSKAVLKVGLKQEIQITHDSASSSWFKADNTFPSANSGARR